jgi:hypothetical protein
VKTTTTKVKQSLIEEDPEWQRVHRATLQHHTKAVSKAFLTFAQANDNTVEIVIVLAVAGDPLADSFIEGVMERPAAAMKWGLLP